MEEDGKFDVELEWKFQEIETSNKPSPSHNMQDVDPVLKHGVVTYSKQQCNVWPNAEVCIWSFFSQITANSNEYAKLHKDAGKGCFGGSKWINITLEEMIHFLGNVLKMSIDDRKLGGYCEYFDESIGTDLAEVYPVNMDGFRPWQKMS